MADYQWSPTAGRFRDADTGRFVTDATILAHVEAIITAGQQRLGGLTARLTTGDLPPAGWQTATSRVLADLHLTSTALAAGGWAQLSADAQRWAAGRLQGELGYLRDLATGYAAGGVSAAQLAARAGMYAEAVGGTFHAARQQERAAAGVQEARRALGGSTQHCADCVRLAGLGWRPLADVPPPGTACRYISRCKCRLLFRRARARVGAET